MKRQVLDLLVVGAGPTGIAIGAEAVQADLEVLLVDRGPLCAAILKFPDSMTFFTTRDRLEIAGIPLAIPEDKPNRRQALAYYQSVARRYRLPLALYEDVVEARKDGELFVITTRFSPLPPRRAGTTGHGRSETRQRRARAVALATGYFDQPKSLGVAGEELPWVSCRYREPYPHYGEHVVVVGGGNSACETALDLWRNNVRVTMVVRKPALKPTVKYWVKPDAENRIAEGSIAALFESEITSFGDNGEVLVEGAGGRQVLEADAAYVLIGYLPDAAFERRCGIEVDGETLVPSFDPESCESGVPGLYIAGTLQAGRDTGRIFIENSRRHSVRIVRHLARRLHAGGGGLTP